MVLSGGAAAVAETRQAIEALTQEDLPIEVQQTLSRMLDEVLVISVTASAASSAAAAPSCSASAVESEREALQHTRTHTDYRTKQRQGHNRMLD